MEVPCTGASSEPTESDSKLVSRRNKSKAFFLFWIEYGTSREKRKTRAPHATSTALVVIIKFKARLTSQASRPEKPKNMSGPGWLVGGRAGLI